MRFRYQHSLKVAEIMESDLAEDSPTPVGALCQRLDAFHYLPYFVLRDDRQDVGDDLDAAQTPCTCDKQSIEAFFRSQTGWAKHEIEGMFQGLCLDCMYTSLYGDGDYWRNGRQHRHDDGCSIQHYRLTWLFSYCGKPDAMGDFLEQEGFDVQQNEHCWLPLDL
jgi:hypothetical protein